jgi:hypothetical protein
MPAIFPDQPAPAVRVHDGQRELIMMRSFELPRNCFGNCGLIERATAPGALSCTFILIEMKAAAGTST